MKPAKCSLCRSQPGQPAHFDLLLSLILLDACVSSSLLSRQRYEGRPESHDERGGQLRPAGPALHRDIGGLAVFDIAVCCAGLLLEVVVLSVAQSPRQSQRREI